MGAITSPKEIAGGTLASNNWKAAVATYGDLPAVGNTNGDLRVVLDEDTVYTWDAGTASWVVTYQTPLAHKTTHQFGGTDVLSVANLLGVLGTKQDADKLQGRNVESAAPSDGDVLTWELGTTTWKAKPSAGCAYSKELHTVDGTDVSNGYVDFTGGWTVGNDSLFVYYNGLLLELTTHYTETSATRITFGGITLTAGDKIQLRWF